MDHSEKITVQITRHSFAEGIPYSQGQIVDLSPRIAHEMIAADAARRFTPPAKASITTPIEPTPEPAAPAAGNTKKAKTKSS